MHSTRVSSVPPALVGWPSVDSGACFDGLPDRFLARSDAVAVFLSPAEYHPKETRRRSAGAGCECTPHSSVVAFRRRRMDTCLAGVQGGDLTGIVLSDDPVWGVICRSLPAASNCSAAHNTFAPAKRAYTDISRCYEQRLPRRRCIAPSGQHYLTDSAHASGESRETAPTGRSTAARVSWI